MTTEQLLRHKDLVAGDLVQLTESMYFQFLTDLGMRTSLDKFWKRLEEEGDLARVRLLRGSKYVQWGQPVVFLDGVTLPGSNTHYCRVLHPELGPCLVSYISSTGRFWRRVEP